jgi:hypothetical protein
MELILGLITTVVGIVGTYFFTNKRAKTATKTGQEALDSCQLANSNANNQIKALEKEVIKYKALTKRADGVFTEVKAILKCDKNIDGAISTIDIQWRNIPIDCDR